MSKNYELNIFKCNLVRESVVEFPQIQNSDNAAEILMSLGIGFSCEEYVYILCLNVKGQVVGIHEISHGDVSSASISPASIFKRILLNNSCAYILAHTHPSHDCCPSQDDIICTERLLEASRIMGINFVDHIILGGDNHLSMKAEGLMP